MSRLIECPSCEGLRPVGSERCPQCDQRSALWSRWFRRAALAVGFGAVGACGVPPGAVADYGVICLPDSGCGVVQQKDGGTEDGGVADGG